MADVSVIIPSYNIRGYIGQAIESALAQTDVPREIFVIDSSNDNTVEIIERYVHRTKGRVVLIRHSGFNISRARNMGIERATSKYIAFLDADDIWLPEKTSRQLEAFRQFPDAAGIFCRSFNFKNNLDDLNRKELQHEQKYLIDDPDIEHIMYRQIIAPSATMISRSTLGKVRFDERTNHGEDTVFFADIRMAEHFRLIYAPMVGRRMHPAQSSKLPWHTIWNVETRIRWCREHAEEIGSQLAQKLEYKLCMHLVEFLERCYWRRRMDKLDDMRRKVTELCPELMAKSFLSKKKLYPRWAYLLRDIIFK